MGRRRLPPDALTPREQEVLMLLRESLSNPDIAERVGISREAVKFHVSQILSKLGVATREEAAVWQPEPEPERRSPWSFVPLALRIALAASAAVVLVAAGFLAWGVASSTGDGPGQSIFWDGTGDVHGVGDVSFTDITLEENAALAPAIATVRIDSLSSVELPSYDDSNVIYEDPADRARIEQVNKILASLPIHTTYEGKVGSWIKGSGEETLQITGFGGVSTLDGSMRFADGSFLLEPGRTYLLFLYRDSVDGHLFYGSAREAFDLTDGVKVLNSQFTRDLEHFEQMSVDDFVDYVRDVSAHLAPPEIASAAATQTSPSAPPR
ncbi:MAG: helix-turn-helix transcriptional regulator [Chloroflexota bacterium]